MSYEGLDVHVWSRTNFYILRSNLQKTKTDLMYNVHVLHFVNKQDITSTFVLDFHVNMLQEQTRIIADTV